MTVPVYLAVAQWVLLLSLGALVALMFRQLGRHLGGRNVTSDLGPQVGSPAADIEFQLLNPGGEAGGGQRDDGGGDPHDGGAELFRPGGGRAALVAFVDPTCPSCEELVGALNAADAAGELAGVRALLLMSEPPSYLQISDSFRQSRLPLGRVLSGATLEAYRVSATPLLVSVDGAGTVRAAGPAARQPDVRSFVHASLLPAPAAQTLPVAAGTQDAAAGDVMTVITGEER